MSKAKTHLIAEMSSVLGMHWLSACGIRNYNKGAASRNKVTCLRCLKKRKERKR